VRSFEIYATLPFVPCKRSLHPGGAQRARVPLLPLPDSKFLPFAPWPASESVPRHGIPIALRSFAQRASGRSATVMTGPCEYATRYHASHES